MEQSFLAACWLKSGASLVESWHALGAAIREAQEQGMHKEALPYCLSDYDLEWRRRVWCILYVWDWYIVGEDARSRWRTEKLVQARRGRHEEDCGSEGDAHGFLRRAAVCRSGVGNVAEFMKSQLSQTTRRERPSYPCNLYC